MTAGLARAIGARNANVDCARREDVVLAQQSAAAQRAFRTARRTMAHRPFGRGRERRVSCRQAPASRPPGRLRRQGAQMARHELYVTHSGHELTPRSEGLGRNAVDWFSPSRVCIECVD